MGARLAYLLYLWFHFSCVAIAYALAVGFFAYYGIYILGYIIFGG